jgi:CRP/FNR family cyclic AMP-dependent transcriptional regulator
MAVDGAQHKCSQFGMGDIPQHHGLLRATSFFAALTDQQFNHVLALVQYRRYDRHAIIIRAQDKSDALYVLLAGRAKVLCEDGKGKQVVVATIGPGEVFGEMGVVDGSPRSAVVQALDASTVGSISRAATIACLTQNAAASFLLLKTVVSRLRGADRKIETLAFVNVYGRVARLLLDASREVNGQWLVDPGSEEIARLVAASREMVSRVVKTLIEQGLVRRHRRKLIVVDRGRLEQAVA